MWLNISEVKSLLKIILKLFLYVKETHESHGVGALLFIFICRVFFFFFFWNLLRLQHLQKEGVAWIFIGAFYFKDIHEQEKCYFQDIHEQEKANLDFFFFESNTMNKC